LLQYCRIPITYPQRELLNLYFTDLLIAGMFAKQLLGLISLISSLFCNITQRLLAVSCWC